MFHLSTIPLKKIAFGDYVPTIFSPSELYTFLRGKKFPKTQSPLPPEIGATVTFEGIVRNHNDGKSVVALEYEAFEQLTIKEADKILSEAKSQFDLLHIECVHRIGKLSIGEPAIRIEASCAHRDNAFKACRYVLDEIKRRVPIWKKEHYQNGSVGWVNAQCECSATHISSTRPKIDTSTAAPTISPEEEVYYSRQMILPQINKQGQKKLKKSRVLVVGLGGLGSPALQNLAGAGVGTIGICEFDRLQAHNLHRQTIYAYAELGQAKSKLAAERIKNLNPFIKVIEHPSKITSANIEKIVKGYDLILECSDNFMTKFLLNDVAVLKKKPLIQASIYQWEGQLRSYIPSASSPCLRCLWKEIPKPDCVDNCAQAGVLGVVPAILGGYQAWEALKFILNLPDQLGSETLLIDLQNYSLRRVRQKQNSSCPLCGKHPTISRIEEKNYFSEDLPAEQNAVDINIAHMPQANFNAHTLIDIRENDERRRNPIPLKKCLHLPLSRFEKTQHKLSQNQKYLFFCGKGLRSRRLAVQLRAKGFKQAFSIVNGVSAVKKHLLSHPTNDF